jgi:uncharacterized protein (TIGR00369 family)
MQRSQQVRDEVGPSRVTVISDAPPGLFGMSTPVQDGWCFTATIPSGTHLTGPDGRMSVGALGVLTDEILGYAVMAGLGPDAWSISTELWVDLLGVLPAEGILSGRARSVQHGSFAIGEVVTSDGAVVASCRERGRQVDFDVAEYEGPAPTRAAPVGRDVVDLLSMELVDGGALMKVDAQHANPRGFLHGGISFALCEVAATASRVVAGSPLATTSVHVVHTRPAPLGAVVEAVVSTPYAGRSLWLSDVSALVDGKVCATARVSAQELVG